MPNMDEIINSLRQELAGRIPPPPLPEKTRRAMERIIAKYRSRIEQEGEDDKRYFIENPSRNHRVRFAFANEDKQLREMSELNPCWNSLPSDMKIVVLVKQVIPGVRMKKPAIMPEEIQVTAEELILTGEETAKGIYDAWYPGFGRPQSP